MLIELKLYESLEKEKSLIPYFETSLDIEDFKYFLKLMRLKHNVNDKKTNNGMNNFFIEIRT